MLSWLFATFPRGFIFSSVKNAHLFSQNHSFCGEQHVLLDSPEIVSQSYSWRPREPGAVSCSPRLVITLGFTTGDAQIVLRTCDFLRFQLASGAHCALSLLILTCGVKHHNDGQHHSFPVTTFLSLRFSFWTRSLVCLLGSSS